MASNDELLTHAVEHHQSGRLQQAESLCREVLKAQPSHVDALHLLGVLEHQAGRSEAAIALICKAIYLSPNAAAFYSSLGMAFRARGQTTEAMRCYQQALERNPKFAHAHYNMGNLFRDMGQPDDAAACYRQALQLKPEFLDALSNLGLIHKSQGQLAEAIQCLREAVRLDPTGANGLVNLGIALKEQGELAEAGVCYEEALRLCPDHALTCWNRSLLRLLQGDFAGGWPDFELRWQAAGSMPRHADRPRWDGGPLEGKTILLHAEQSMADTLQFVRFATVVKKRGGRVVLECQPALLRLLAGVAGVDHVLPAGASLPPFDVQAPLLSVPSLLRATPETLGTLEPYLRPEAELVSHWHAQLAPLAGYKVGIAWQSDSADPDDQVGAIPLRHFEALAHVDGVHLLSLQTGSGADQIRPLREFTVLDLGDRFAHAGGLDEMAAAIMNLDMVVTADTVVAHLAGALGARVWTVLPAVPEWRWQMDRPDSPWYPTMRLFRQRQRGNWAEVMQRVAESIPFDE
jgi:tetratricopeptide (TPR) repeat protein